MSEFRTFMAALYVGVLISIGVAFAETHSIALGRNEQAREEVQQRRRSAVLRRSTAAWRHRFVRFLDARAEAARMRQHGCTLVLVAYIATAVLALPAVLPRTPRVGRVLAIVAGSVTPLLAVARYAAIDHVATQLDMYADRVDSGWLRPPSDTGLMSLFVVTLPVLAVIAGVFGNDADGARVRYRGPTRP